LRYGDFGSARLMGRFDEKDPSSPLAARLFLKNFSSE
jgi:hypothetical protein